MVQYIENGDAAVFDGLVFRRDKRTNYFLNARTRKRLHVYIWEYYNGKVPEGYHVHHVDFNKDNNEPENLVLLTASEHLSLHGKTWEKERYDKQVKVLQEKAQPKAAIWHGSEAGKAWHKQHYEKMKDAWFKKKEFTCEFCGKPFFAINKGVNRFCSNNCKSAYRRKTGVDNETRACSICGKEFSTNKYSRAKTCSRECRMRLYWNNKYQKNYKEACV